MQKKLKVNGSSYQVDVDADTPLLWVLRDYIQLTGTKFSCGEGLCGACTVLVNGKTVRSCSYPIANIKDQDIVTIEGVAISHPVIQAWKQMDVPQCGYCQSGQILSTISLLSQKSAPSSDDIAAAMQNICRCGTYPEIKQAVDLSIELNAKEA